MDIAPCPFCGKPAEYVCEDDHHGDYFRLGCTDEDCPAHWTYYTEPQENAEKCIARWNSRMHDDAQPTPDYRQALENARQEIVLAIAFLGRDIATKRLDITATQLCARLVNADAAIREALAAQPPAAPVRKACDACPLPEECAADKCMIYPAMPQKLAAPVETTFSSIHDALKAANLEYSAFSTDGVVVFGDKKSVQKAAEAFHSHSQIDHFRTQIRHWREECGKLHARLDSASSVPNSSADRAADLTDAHLDDLRSHIRGSQPSETGTYEYELGSGWRCFHCGEMFRTWGGASLHFGKPADKRPTCVTSDEPQGTRK